MFELKDGKYYESHRGLDNDGEPFNEWIEIHTSRVPLIALLDEWENLNDELMKKTGTLLELKEEYKDKEFNIVFKSDIDFKSLYGSTAEKVRKQHAKTELKSLDEKIIALELAVDKIRARIELLKYIIHTKNVLIESQK